LKKSGHTVSAINPILKRLAAVGATNRWQLAARWIF
jgi:hypothetical protein